MSKEIAVFTNRVKKILSGFDVIHSFNMFSHISKSFATYDEIIYMHSGQIVEQGSFVELMASKGAFYDFYTIVD